jgi:hypothetical protein
LQFRYAIETAEARLVDTNESLVTQINLSEKFLGHMERKQAQWQSCCSIAASLPDPPRVETTIRQGRVFSPSPVAARTVADYASDSGEEGGRLGREDRGSHPQSSNWYYVWEGDAIADKKRIVEQLKTTLASLQGDFGVAISGMEAVEVTISRIDRYFACSLTVEMY